MTLWECLGHDTSVLFINTILCSLECWHIRTPWENNNRNNVNKTRPTEWGHGPDDGNQITSRNQQHETQHLTGTGRRIQDSFQLVKKPEIPSGTLSGRMVSCIRRSLPPSDGKKVPQGLDVLFISKVSPCTVMPWCHHLSAHRRFNPIYNIHRKHHRCAACH